MKQDEFTREMALEMMGVYQAIIAYPITAEDVEALAFAAGAAAGQGVPIDDVLRIISFLRPNAAAHLARLFHEWYERLAPSFGYETRRETAVPWHEIPEDSPNKRLMIAVCRKILHGLETED